MPGSYSQLGLMNIRKATYKGGFFNGWETAVSQPGGGDMVGSDDPSVSSRVWLGDVVQELPQTAVDAVHIPSAAVEETGVSLYRFVIRHF